MNKELIRPYSNFYLSKPFDQHYQTPTLSGSYRLPVRPTNLYIGNNPTTHFGTPDHYCNIHDDDNETEISYSFFTAHDYNIILDNHYLVQDIFLEGWHYNDPRLPTYATPTPALQYEIANLYHTHNELTKCTESTFSIPKYLQLREVSHKTNTYYKYCRQAHTKHNQKYETPIIPPTSFPPVRKQNIAGDSAYLTHLFNKNKPYCQRYTLRFNGYTPFITYNYKPN